MPGLKEIADYGAATVVVGLAIWLIRWLVKSRVSERKEYLAAQERYDQKIQQTTDRFLEVVTNHLNHNTEVVAANSEVIRHNTGIVERCCDVLDRLNGAARPPNP